jgi:polyketide cyclase/dehydrase/lipid transport protein
LIISHSFELRHSDFVIRTQHFARCADERPLNKIRPEEETMYHRPMFCRVLSGLGSILLVSGSNTFSAEFSSSVSPKDGWKLAADAKEVIIYSRPHADSNLKEFKAIGSIDAPSYAVHAVIDDFENYPKFMPYTLECRLLGREGDSMIGYQRLSPKICEDRDYTLRVSKKSWPGPKGLTYLSQWETANEMGPAEQKNVVRIKVCNGTWLLEPDGPAKTRATYSIYSDTGGLIPAFIANHASLTAIKKLYAAIRKQVKEPKYAAASQASPAPARP